VSVSDNGPGIPEDMQEKIFERFWQISEKNRSGLGIGLYISKMIVEAHRGRIWVESKVGQGSTFSFTLPLGRKSKG
jgi:signal transduction histidine kinase